MDNFTKKIDDFFLISKNKSSIKNEILGGISAYLAMAYIIFVNPQVLGAAGMNKDAVFVATIIGAFIATLIMGLYAKFPLGLAPCMSMNAFFAYSVVLGSKLTWQEALSCVLLSSIIFIILSLTQIRTKILQAIPNELKTAGSVGLGLFIAFIGLKNSGIIIPDDVLFIKMGSFSNVNVIISGIGITTLIILLVKKNKNAIIFSMLSALISGLIISLLNTNGIINLSDDIAKTLPIIPESIFVNPLTPINTMINETLFVSIYNIPKVLTISGISIILTFTFLDFFGTAATLNAATSEIKNLDIDTKNKKIYLADAIGSFFGSLLGTSNITTYIESVGGIISGARTGLMAVVVAILFLFSLLFYPFLSLFTAAITAPALFAVGIFMFRNVSIIEWNKSFEKTIPSFLTIILMPLTGSIALGLTFGFVSYTLLMLVAKRKDEIHQYMYFISIISIIYILSELI